MKCKVLMPLTRSTPKNGFESFTHDDLIEIADPEEAKRMEAAGIVLIVGASEPAPETMEQKMEGIERLVKPSASGKGKHLPAEVLREEHPHKKEN